MAKETEKSSIPPYVPYKTFKNFLDGLNPVPSVIDSHVLKTMGGALRSQLLSSLRYLGLINSDNRSQPELKTLAASKDDSRKKELTKLLTEHYPFLFEANDFSLAEGTYPQLVGKFQAEGAAAETAKRCVRFFLDAAKESGIAISPYIQSEPIKTKSERNKPASRERNSAKRKNGHEDGDGIPAGDGIPQSEWQTKLKTALDLLPGNFDKSGKAHWTKASRDSFYAVITAIVDAYAMVDDKPAT